MGTLPTTWEGAHRSFLLHLKATRAEKTVRYYKVQLLQLIKWANAEGISLESFGKRILDEYLSHRLDTGTSRMTLRHDCVCAKVFTKWCAKNDYLSRDPLAEYEVRKAPTPEKYMPSEEDIRTLLAAIGDFWDKGLNPHVAEIAASKRAFHRDRFYAIFLTLLDTACRFGEVLSLHVGDYRETERQITIRESKGRTARTIPVSDDTAAALGEWLKVRKRVMKDVPKDQDEGILFMSETGTRICDRNFSRSFRLYINHVALTKKITPHGIRRFSLNKLAKHNLLMAQAIAGHKNPQTTLIYTRIDPEFVRAEHEEVGVVRGVLHSKRAVKKPRLI